MSPVGRTVLLCVVFISLVLGAFVYTTLQTPELSDEELRDRGVFVMPRPRDVASFSLEDHTGAAFDNESLKGKWSFLFFGFTHCPDICPTTMSEMGQAERQMRQADPELADGFRGVLVSVDPERDTSEQLQSYVSAFSPSFLGVRGDIAATGVFAQQVNVAFAKVPTPDGRYTMDHSGQIVIINPEGHYHGFIKLPHQAETIRLAYQSLAARF